MRLHEKWIPTHYQVLLKFRNIVHYMYFLSIIELFPSLICPTQLAASENNLLNFKRKKCFDHLTTWYTQMILFQINQPYLTIFAFLFNVTEDLVCYF